LSSSKSSTEFPMFFIALFLSLPGCLLREERGYRAPS
jgi:hypothetical protein